MSLTDDIHAPWRISDTGSALKITDARDRSVAWVYYPREGALGAEYLTRNQAVEIAKAAGMVNQPLTTRHYDRRRLALPA
jgi:hypothetical protein